MGGEAQRLMLDHLEQLEHRGGVERDAAKHKGVEACPKRVYICGPAPAATAAEADESQRLEQSLVIDGKRQHDANAAQSVEEPKNQEGLASSHVHEDSYQPADSPLGVWGGGEGGGGKGGEGGRTGGTWCAWATHSCRKLCGQVCIYTLNSMT